MIRNLNAKRSYSRLILLVLLLAAVVSSSTRMTVHAAISVPDNIRVALYVNLGTNKYQSITSIATLQSAGGIKLSWKDPQASFPVGSVPAGQGVRFAVDGYRALLLETTDLNAAIIVLKKVQASSSAAFVTQLTKSGKTVYQVTEGVYSSVAGASSALAKWTNAGVATGIQSLVSARVLGPWSVETGPYASAAEASAAADMIGNAGLDAYVALKPKDGALNYVVRIGQEKDATTLTAVQEAATSAGGMNVRIPAAGEPYAVVRTDMTYNGSANKPVSLYAIPSGAGAVLRADPEGAGGIQVIERSKRTYRGSMEMSVLNQTLAVVNDVNFEQYLYSVVGTEVSSSWPIEAQKAQAVAARSYALSTGLGFQIAHVVDTTNSQAYYGIGSENANATAGVTQTAREVLTLGGKVINAVFSSNAGGVTADNTLEIWGGDNSFLATNVQSPDSVAQTDKRDWYYVALPSGQTGYIRDDLLADSGQTHSSGAKLLNVISEGTAVRSEPRIVSTVEPIARVGSGTIVIQLNKVGENTDFTWVKAPMTPEQLLTALNKRAKTPITGPLLTLEVSKRGPSGRATEIKANGIPVNVGVPDNLRGALNGLQSTLFQIDETGRYTVLDGSGNSREMPSQGGTLQVIGSGGETRALTDQKVYIMDGKGNLRAATTSPQFIFSGKGNGHGGGMSQWGARALAEQGYDYQYILKYYYKNVTIEKDART
ncbi:SpoIID/LytB domain-containing protein [Cohnella silvisoli]|uniref:SpoIID/LytB domain-containing protein n=1 Tax=Cohnella silvisoli TaxID=2873699 RepID=A0ABV1KP10_9BACL|nr:SpoIID/LytB domain-containing protein [Cohnella silvisoli]MCD9025681.1 SpoIID/LytB domain-containing protein [Cohnella silvisoli]